MATKGRRLRGREPSHELEREVGLMRPLPRETIAAKGRIRKQRPAVGSKKKYRPLLGYV